MNKVNMLMTQIKNLLHCDSYSTTNNFFYQFGNYIVQFQLCDRWGANSAIQQTLVIRLPLNKDNQKWILSIDSKKVFYLYDFEDSKTLYTIDLDTLFDEVDTEFWFNLELLHDVESLKDSLQDEKFYSLLKLIKDF